MKHYIFLLLMLACIGGVSANPTYSQSTKLSLKFDNKALVEVFREIEKQSEYIFFYNDEVVNANEKVNLSVDDASIFEILDKLLDKKSAGYKVIDRQVILFKNDTEPETAEEVAATKQSGQMVTGNVRSSNGEPLIGVSVMEKGTTNGTITDFDGNFSIQTGANVTLVFSYVGFQTQEVALKGKTKLSIILEEDIAGLDEVVVVAYGTQRKSSVTGSITSIKADELRTVTSPSVQSMLTGKIAGVSSLPSSGKPGEMDSKIRVRGKTSPTTDQSPLWVVDGVIDGLSQQINPNDIESMTILKDASATALYGSRGANGVILVTTKSAKMGVQALQVSAKLGISTLTRGNFKMMNSRELYEYTDSMFEPGSSSRPNWLTPALMKYDTDWWDIVTQTALSQNYNLSYTFGTDKIRSFLSADYYTEEGTVKGYEFDKYTVRVNTDYIVSPKLTIRTKLSANYGQTDDKSYSLSAASLNLPWDTPYDSMGNLKTGKEGTGWKEGDDTADFWFGRGQSNFLYDNRYKWTKDERFGVNGTFGFDYRFTDYLVFESTNNITLDHRRRDKYRDPLAQESASDQGRVDQETSYDRNLYANQLLRFNHKFVDKHQVDAFVGFEYYTYFHHESNVGATGIPSAGEILSVATTPVKTDGDKWESKSLSYYFNGNYTYDDRLMGQVSVRRDGSSRFGRDNKYGTFFTISGGWNMHNEAFLKNITWIDALKLRLSYGSVGATPTQMYQHMGLYTLDAHYNKESAAYPHQMANRKLTWEKSYTTNVGFDTHLFNRVDITADFYVKNTSDLLYMVNLPTLSGYSYQYQNIGEVRNTGFELTVNPDIIRTKDWYWGLGFNISYNKNEIRDLYEGQSQVEDDKIREIGDDLDTWYLREWAGVDPDNGNPLWFVVDEEGNKSLTTDANEATRVKMGTSSPKVFGGFSTTLSYKDLTLAAYFTYALGHKIYHSSRANYDHDGKEITYNSMKLPDGWSRWEKPGDVVSHPKAMFGGNNDSNATSSRYLEKGDYLKLSTLTLSYNLPKVWLTKIGVKNASVGVSGENLFTLTKFTGKDPEVVTGDANKGSSGTDVYPVPRRVSFNLNFTF